MIRNIKHGQGIKSGIYKITNLINGKYYIGSTKHLSSRYRSHFSSLKRKVSGCIILQNAVNKYGIENFEFSIIEICENYKEREIEIFNINLPPYNSIRETVVRREISKQTRKCMSEAQLKTYKNGRKAASLKGRKFNRYKKKKVILKYKNMEKSYNSVEECAEEFKCTITAIYQNYYRKTLLKHKYKVILVQP